MIIETQQFSLASKSLLSIAGSSPEILQPNLLPVFPPLCAAPATADHAQLLDSAAALVQAQQQVGMFAKGLIRG